MKPQRAVAGYLNSIAVERSLSDNTVSAYSRDLDRYLAYLDTLAIENLSDLTGEQVAGFAEYLSDEGLAPSSLARTLTAVRSFHKFALGEGWTEDNPAKDLKLPKQDKRLPKPISIEEVTALIDAASIPDPPIGPRDQALMEVLYGTGARISEAVGLAIDDVDLEGHAVRLFGKGRKERVVPLGSYAIDAIEAYLVRARPELASKGKGTPALFLNTLGRPLSRQSAWAVIQACADRAGITSHISPHTLRHSYATHLLSGGADVRVVQELLGHSSVTTTQIYTAVSIETLKETFATSHPRARSAR
ncbi:site-specific tyrosine recombinase XerD [Flaviflexus ciconiae]|uniref:Tyrosine recombinase XerD n=1 Tax=Flaviflexus ciconiae TaxID=2496867 RepID=A0A3S9PW59_9ACTO|nr:site-specific tyrosine recombinase XerD [Flaviflexus ciconiae]AZQ76601.1 site-specific tyrosine recombinase XerD [Flaviflexus ciconiae]